MVNADSELPVNNNGQDKGGRPTKYTPRLVELLLAALADGLNKTQACKAVGIGVSTLSDWLDRFSELSGQVEQAREQARQKALAGIKSAGQGGDWRGGGRFFKYSFPADYKQPGTKIDLTANAQQANIVCDEQTRHELQEQRDRLLSAKAPT